jgi:hypothetical protein
MDMSCGLLIGPPGKRRPARKTPYKGGASPSSPFKRPLKRVKRTIEKPKDKKQKPESSRKQIQAQRCRKLEITFGSDCSGYGTEVLAAEALGLKRRARFVFACEKDPAVRSILTHNTKHERVDEDVTTKDMDTLPHVNNYTNGSPCTTFSLEGKQELSH